MKKLVLTLMILAFLACPAMAQRYRQMQIAIVDEFGQAVTNIDTIEVYDAGTSTTSTIYSTRAGVARTNPMTTTSGGFDQSTGIATWFQAAASFKVTVTETGASQALTVDNLTSENVRFAWFVNYIGEAATLQVNDGTTLDIGTGDDFVHDWDNSNSRYIIKPAADGGRLDFGLSAVHTDVYFHAGDITTDYMLFDEGSLIFSLIDIDLLVDDEAKILIGDSSDVTIEYDESNNDLDITSTTALDLIAFGADTDGYDLQWFGTTTATYALFDYSADELLLLLADLKISQGSQIEFIDVSDGLTDWTIDNATDETLLIYPTETTDDQTVNLGNATNTTDLRIFGATASTVVFDASGDEVIYNAYDISLQDDDLIKFGDGDDWWITSGTAKTLDMIPGATADSTAVLNIGADGAGADLILFGETASQTTWWDASTDQWFFGANAEGVDVTFYGDTASSYAKWDEDAETNGAFIFEAADLHMMDADYLIFGDGSDFKVHSTTTKILNLTPAAASDDYQVLLGSDQSGVDLGLYGTTASAYALWDASANALWVEGSDIFLGDSDLLVFGDAIGTGDIKVYATGTDLIIDGIVAETGTVAIGVTDVGLDFKLWAATNAEGVLWDASDEALEFTGANITLDSASVLTLGETVNADVVVTTGTYAVTAANSGKIHVIPDLAGATSIDLPTEADGLYYKFIYVGGADEAHTHTIDSENNTNYFIGGVAFADTDAGDAADEINAGVYSDGNSNSKCAIINASAGTVVEVHCDGTNWYITGIVFSATVPTFADQ